MSEKIKGAIIIYSCHKYKDTRLKKFKLEHNEYGGYKVFYVLGNPNITNDYIFIENMLIIKCEDSYIHLLKKVCLGMKIISETYTIEEGIIRCGDDIMLNEEKLINFATTPNKYHYIGYKTEIIKTYKEERIYNTFMYDYYRTRQEDFTNILHGLKDKTIDDIQKLSYIPRIDYAVGVIYYLSMKSVEHIINHMKSIEYNIFKEENGTYPYTIEDVGIGYILNKYNIPLLHYPLYGNNKFQYEQHQYCFGIHTNYLK
jgi:hypothetical protein